MRVEIQRASVEQAAEIAAIKREVWPDEWADAAYLAAVVAEPDHVTHIGWVDGLAAGLVSGFVTLDENGVRRWEVDLLGVLPAYRGRGLAIRLVAASTASGYEIGAAMARGLVAVGNTGSEKAFARAGYGIAAGTCGLYVSDGAAEMQSGDAAGAYLLPVTTLNYRGIWVEGRITEAGLWQARAVRTRYGWQIAGAVIPLADTVAAGAAQAAGYALVGQYRWWTHNGR
ncbi:MAG: GNAT family N-acetyltransferase [Chloroflexi bacterium]|nr:GNAT family N-acetyltransferase [Chloroflexota bacterium]